MRVPITREEQRRTPRQVLARHLTLPRPRLSDAERDELIDAGLADEDELVPAETTVAAGPSGTQWTYAGHRWGVICRSGRPSLVRACDAPREPLTAVEQVERRFASAVLLVELLSGGIMSDESVAELRWEPPWSWSFEEAEREDAGRLVGHP